jgi:SAM-dependent methyltransferase
MQRLIQERYPTLARVWTNAIERNPPEWERELSGLITRVFGDEPSARWDEAVDGYAEFCTEAMRAQVYFERHGRYQATNYADVVRACYHDADYMQRRYLPGQFLSHFVWPHHNAMLHRYLTVLLPKFAGEVTTFYEIGVGCGMYSLQTLKRLPHVRGVGYDISTYSTDFTKRVIDACGLGGRYHVSNEDIVAHRPAAVADFVINQEVLEHLEDPAGFVKGLVHTVRPGGWGYITAAVNAAHTDHIYLYRSPDEVERQLVDAGWRIVDTQVESNYPEKPIERRPTIVGFLVQRPA